MERVTWRSKQALDFSFLMMYAKDRGTFYVQLEDDVLTKKGYITTMKKFALGRIAEKKPWFVIDFCQLGFIGKMFKSVELPWLVNFFLMFYNDKPGKKIEISGANQIIRRVKLKLCNLMSARQHCLQNCKKFFYLQNFLISFTLLSASGRAVISDQHWLLYDIFNIKVSH